MFYLNPFKFATCSITIIICLLPFQAFAKDFIELNVDPPENSSDIDKTTLLINRTNIAHVAINVTKTPERAWYKVHFYGFNPKTKDQNEALLFALECNSSKAITSIKSAVKGGSKKAINATELCRLLD